MLNQEEKRRKVGSRWPSQMKMNYVNIDYTVWGKYTKAISDFSQLTGSASLPSSVVCTKHLTNHNMITDSMSVMIHNCMFYFSLISFSQICVCVFILAYALQIYITGIYIICERNLVSCLSHQTNINENWGRCVCVSVLACVCHLGG